MKLIRSRGAKLFKKEVGQSAHMLITIMVGIDAIVPNDIKASGEFHAVWNPKDKAASADRSRVFAKKSSLVWMVDCIDMYLRLSNQNPSVISDSGLKNAIDSPDNNRNIYKRLEILCTHYDLVNPDFALVDTLLNWRNRLTHFNASNEISKTSRKTLTNDLDHFKEQYRGLDTQLMIGAFDSHAVPTFKEVASFLRASINLVYELDKKLVSDLDVKQYADKVLLAYFSEKGKEDKRLDNIFSKGQVKAYKSLRQILIQNGFDEEADEEIDALCARISKTNFQEIRSMVRVGSFIN